MLPADPTPTERERSDAAWLRHLAGYMEASGQPMEQRDAARLRAIADRLDAARGQAPEPPQSGAQAPPPVAGDDPLAGPRAAPATTCGTCEDSGSIVVGGPLERVPCPACATVAIRGPHDAGAGGLRAVVEACAKDIEGNICATPASDCTRTHSEEKNAAYREAAEQLRERADEIVAEIHAALPDVPPRPSGGPTPERLREHPDGAGGTEATDCEACGHPRAAHAGLRCGGDTLPCSCYRTFFSAPAGGPAAALTSQDRQALAALVKWWCDHWTDVDRASIYDRYPVQRQLEALAPGLVKRLQAGEHRDVGRA